MEDRQPQRLIPRFSVSDLLTLLFYMLAVSSVISYFVWLEEYPKLFVWLGIAAGAVRIVYYILRFFTRNK